MPCSVTGNRFVDAATDFGNAIKTVLRQVMCNLSAAAAGMAQDRYRQHRIMLNVTGRYLVHGYIDRPLDAGNVDLPCFSDVQQLPKFSGIASTNVFRWCYILDHIQDLSVFDQHNVRRRYSRCREVPCGSRSSRPSLMRHH